MGLPGDWAQESWRTIMINVTERIRQNKMKNRMPESCSRVYHSLITLSMFFRLYDIFVSA